MRYVSRVPQPPLDQLVDDLYYLEGSPPYPRFKLPPMPSAVLILNLGDRFLIGDSAEFADGCLLTTATRHLDFAYPASTRSVGVHFKPWGWAAFVGIPGYFDQSHFVKEFQAFTGCTPTAYLALRRRFLAEHPGNALDVGPLPAD